MASRSRVSRAHSNSASPGQRPPTPPSAERVTSQRPHFTPPARPGLAAPQRAQRSAERTQRRRPRPAAAASHCSSPPRHDGLRLPGRDLRKHAEQTLDTPERLHWASAFRRPPTGPLSSLTASQMLPVPSRVARATVAGCSTLAATLETRSRPPSTRTAHNASSGPRESLDVHLRHLVRTHDKSPCRSPARRRSTTPIISRDTHFT